MGSFYPPEPRPGVAGCVDIAYAHPMAGRKRYGPTAVRVYQMLFDPLISPLRPRVTRLCRTLGVESALDIACGTGAQCRALARAGIRATGLDLSDEMIRLARRHAGPRTSYIRGSAYDLPFQPGSFDVSLLLLALHEHTEDERAQILSEALRVARSHLIVADYQQPHRPWIHPAWQGIRLVETLAGPEHRTGFRQFVRDGSLTGFLARHGRSAREVACSHLGSIRLMSISLADDPDVPEARRDSTALTCPAGHATPGNQHTRSTGSGGERHGPNLAYQHDRSDGSVRADSRQVPTPSRAMANVVDRP